MAYYPLISPAPPTWQLAPEFTSQRLLVAQDSVVVWQISTGIWAGLLASANRSIEQQVSTATQGGADTSTTQQSQQNYEASVYGQADASNVPLTTNAAQGMVYGSLAPQASAQQSRAMETILAGGSVIYAPISTAAYVFLTAHISAQSSASAGVEYQLALVSAAHGSTTAQHHTEQQQVIGATVQTSSWAAPVRLLTNLFSAELQATSQARATPSATQTVQSFVAALSQSVALPQWVMPLGTSLRASSATSIAPEYTRSAFTITSSTTRAQQGVSKAASIEVQAHAHARATPWLSTLRPIASAVAIKSFTQPRFGFTTVLSTVVNSRSILAPKAAKLHQAQTALHARGGARVVVTITPPPVAFMKAINIAPILRFSATGYSGKWDAQVSKSAWTAWIEDRN